MTRNSGPPLHDSLHVVDSEDIYRNDEWWKSVVRYRFDESSEHDEVAVYLWHRDDGWTRKNKYVIKTRDAWETDTTIVNQLFSDPSLSSPDEDLPVSDYYEVGGAETVFRSDGWWKAIVKITQKGSYETEEVMIYLWQEIEGDWRRRQKYTIKSEERWRDEADVVESVLGTGKDRSSTSVADRSTSSATSGEAGATSQPDEFAQLNRELDKHLSEVPVD